MKVGPVSGWREGQEVAILEPIKSMTAPCSAEPGWRCWLLSFDRLQEGQEVWTVWVETPRWGLRLYGATASKLRLVR